MAVVGEVKKILQKWHKKAHIKGWFIDRNTNTLVLVVETQTPTVAELVGLLEAEGVKVEVRQGTVNLLSATEEFFRPWGGERGVLCSPPIDGYTAHHCTGTKNDDHSGILGYLYSKDLSSFDRIRIEKDIPFKPRNFVESFICLLLSLIGKDSESCVNRCDCAEVEKKLDADVTPVGVLFAGASLGSLDYAIGADLKYIDPNIKLSLGDVEKVYATVMHIDFDQDAKIVRFLGYAEREYKIIGVGGVNVYAYNSVYRFEPAYYMVAKPTVICDVWDPNKCIEVKESARPGYSGSVLYIK